MMIISAGIAAVTASVLFAGSFAFASFSMSGKGFSSNATDTTAGGWTSGGTTYATAQSVQITSCLVTTSPTCTPSSTVSLYPGASVSLKFDLANPNKYPVRVNELQLDQTQGPGATSTKGGYLSSVASMAAGTTYGGIAMDTTHFTAGCPTSAYTFTPQTPNVSQVVSTATGSSNPNVQGTFANASYYIPAATTSVASGYGRTYVTLPAALTMNINAPSACQGAQITLYMKFRTSSDLFRTSTYSSTPNDP